MGFIHHTIVGHFAPSTLNASNLSVSKPLDRQSVDDLLATFPPEIAQNVQYADGYVRCKWAGSSPPAISRTVHKFAHSLAKRELCVVAELPYCDIEYPESARVTQAKEQEFFRERSSP